VIVIRIRELVLVHATAEDKGLLRYLLYVHEQCIHVDRQELSN